MASYDCYVGGDSALGDRARAVRRDVFIEEQGVSEAEEMDGRDAQAIHIVVTDGTDPVATARVRFVDGTTVKIERVAVCEPHRGEGLGLWVMSVAESTAHERGATSVVLHAQLRVRSFYEDIGYDAVGDEFEEADIPHVEMVKTLE